MSKIVCEVIVNGEQMVKSITTVPNTAQFVLKTYPGPGKPFWCWESIPTGTVVGADFTGAPLATIDAAENLRLIQSITAKPQDVLIYQTPTP